MILASSWTGRTACALQAAMRMSNQSFAAHLNVGQRTVQGWHDNPDRKQQTGVQQALDKAFEKAPDSVKARFSEILGVESPGESRSGGSAEAEQRLDADPDIGAALRWLDDHAGWGVGGARQEVAARLAELDVTELESRARRRARVDQRSIAQTLGRYYGDDHDAHGRYRARYGKLAAETSVLTSAEWLDLGCPLIAAHDRLKVTSSVDPAFTQLDAEAAGRAAQRLAETLAMGTRLVDKPLYRLLDVVPTSDALNGRLGTTRFVEYAVTMDLLEGELIDAIANDPSTAHESLPLRDKYLPDVDSVIDPGGRLCAGGPLALLALARPASPFRGDADYVLLVQERSGNVLNAARRLAVIPKGFHQPLNDLRTDAQIGATLRREVEEELFGREEIDNTTNDQRSADPMHPSRLSEPMRWFMEDPSRLRMECTGFGLNLMSGNFEFASLIVIDDEEFWERHGGQLQANWESAGLHQYSSRDDDLIGELIGDVAWSNEGLFALLQGLRRLAQIGGDRVNLPSIEWEVG